MQRQKEAHTPIRISSHPLQTHSMMKEMYFYRYRKQTVALYAPRTTHTHISYISYTPFIMRTRKQTRIHTHTLGRLQDRSVCVWHRAHRKNTQTSVFTPLSRFPKQKSNRRGGVGSSHTHTHTHTHIQHTRKIAVIVACALLSPAYLSYGSSLHTNK